MKRVFAFMFSILLIVGCEEQIEKVLPEITLDSNQSKSVNVSAEGQSYDVKFTSVLAWTAEVVSDGGSDDWITLDTASGEGGYAIAKIKVTVQKNETEEQRVAKLVIKSEAASVEIEYTQEGAEPEPEPEPELNPASIPDDEVWYITSDKDILTGLSPDAFDQNVISNTYSDGKGVIKLTGKLQTVRSFAFLNAPFLKYMVLPKSVETFEDHAFTGANLDSLYVPSNLKNFTGYAFESCEVGRFVGESIVQGDGRFIVVEDTLKAVSTIQEKELIVPESIRVIGSHAIWSVNPNVTRLTIEEGVEVIEPYAFSGCKALEEVYLPNSLQDLQYSVFDYCDNIRQFYGPTKYVSGDGRVTYRLLSSDGQIKYIANVAKSGLTDYVIGDDISGLDPESFCRAYDLKTLTINSQSLYVDGDTFDECYNLERIMGFGATPDGRGYVENDKLLIFAGKGIKEYAISNVKGLGSNVFSYQNTLERLVINDEVTYIGNNCFSYCPNLRSITLPAGLEVVRYDPFIGSDNLEEVYFRSLLPPTIEIGGIDQDQYANLTIYVPEQSLDLYLSDPSWAPLNKYMEGYHYDDLE